MNKQPKQSKEVESGYEEKAKNPIDNPEVFKQLEKDKIDLQFEIDNIRFNKGIAEGERRAIEKVEGIVSEIQAKSFACECGECWADNKIKQVLLDITFELSKLKEDVVLKNKEESKQSS